MKPYSSVRRLNPVIFAAIVAVAFAGRCAGAERLLAGAAKVDVSDPAVKIANDPLYVKALVLADGATTVAIITVDAVALGEIGPIRNSYLSEVRGRLQKELNISPG